MVQECLNTNWYTPQGAFFGMGFSNQITCRFTDWTMPAQDTCYFFASTPAMGGQAGMQDCQFHGGQLFSLNTIDFTNCLCERLNFQQLGDSQTLTMRNNLFYGGSFSVSGFPSASIIENNLFDRTQISDDGSYTEGWNGYYSTNNSVNVLSITNVTDVFMTNSPLYEIGPFGNYYQPTNDLLFEKGNTNANLLGLYQYTTQTNQTKEGTNIVTIGYHYVAANTNGLPDDTTGTGVADYLKDANGNGLVDSGEINWTNAADIGLTVIITHPANNSAVP